MTRKFVLPKQTKWHLRISYAEVLAHFICVLSYITSFGGDNLP